MNRSDPHSVSDPAPIRPDVLRRYLLGRLAEEPRDELEVRLLADGDTHAAMLEAETDLVDDYARGHLDDGERRDFETHLLGRPGMADRVATARGLGRWLADEAAAREAEAATAQPATEARTEASNAATPGRHREGGIAAWLGNLLAAPALRPALAAALVLLLVAVGFLAWQTAELRQEMGGLTAAHDRLAGERDDLTRREAELAADLETARATLAEAAGAAEADPATDPATAEELDAARRRIAELEEELEGELEGRRRLPGTRRDRVNVTYLLGLATRSAGVPTVEVPEGRGRVVLQLDAGGDADYHATFQARLLGPGGDELWSRTGLTAGADTGTVDLELPAQAIEPGRYEVLLEGLQDGEAELVGAYELEVRRP